MPNVSVMHQGGFAYLLIFETDLQQQKSKSRNKSLKPKIPELPSEIWLNVFESLDYFQLKTCTMVCKQFKALSECSQFDSKLFRNSTNVLPKGAEIDLKTLHLHPAFDRLSNVGIPDIDDLRLWFDGPGDAYHSCSLKEASAAKEYATDPPVQEISMRIKHFPKFKTQNKYGVTVLQVMAAVSRFFGKTTWRTGTNGVKYQFTYRELMGDRNGWVGWNDWYEYDPDHTSGLLLDHKGGVLLVACHFDS